MADFNDLIRVFQRRSWTYFKLPDADKLFTRFRDNHDYVDLFLEMTSADTLRIIASGIGKVAKAEMCDVLSRLSPQREGLTWGRDPENGQVWAQWSLTAATGQDFESTVVDTIDDLMLRIDRFRTVVLFIHAAYARNGVTPPAAGNKRGIVALSTGDEQALFQFVRADALVDARLLLERYPGLLTQTAEDKLRRMIDDQLTELARRRVAERLALLRRCRSLGIDQAFRGVMGSELIRDDRPTASGGD